MLKLNDGRSELWQWDTGRKLTVDADCSQIHFSNKIFGRSIDVDVVDGVAIIPDVLLQTDNDLNAWAFVGTAENGYTKIAKQFKIHKRNKPSDYVYTPVEQVTLKEVIDRLEELENGGGSGESGKDGATFIPSVSSDGVISWTNDGDMPNPDPVNIKGPQGPQGPQGDDYTLTAADKQEIAEMAAELVPSGGGGSADEYVVIFDKTFDVNVANNESWGGEHTLYDYRHFYCTDVDGNDLKVDAFHVFIHVPAQSADIVQSGEVKVYVGRGKPGWWGSYITDQHQPYIGHSSFVPQSGKEAWCWYDYDLRTQTLTGQRVDGKAFNNNFNSNGILGVPSFPRAIVRNNWQYWNGIELDLASGHLPAGTRVLIYARKLNEAKVAERPR